MQNFNQLYLIDQKFYQDLILKESEDFYAMMKIIKYKSINSCKKIITLFLYNPQILDFISYLFLRIQTSILLISRI